jgi:hypothetical protein
VHTTFALRKTLRLFKRIAALLQPNGYINQYKQFILKVNYLSDVTFDRDRLRDLEMSRHVIWNPAYLRPKSKRDNTERSLDHGSSFWGLVERLSLFRSWRSKKKRKLIVILHCYDCWFNAFIMEQMLAHIIWLFIQCLYYEAGTGSYAMVVRLMFVLWVRYWFLYYVFWFNVYIMKQCQVISGHVSHVLNVGWKCFIEATLAGFGRCWITVSLSFYYSRC